MDFMQPYLQKYGKFFLLSTAFLVVESVCDLLQPTIMARIVDLGVANRDLDLVLHLGTRMVLVAGLGALGAVGRNLISSNVSQRFGADLRSDLFTKVQRLSLEGLSRFETASLITRLTNDITQMQEFVHRLMRVFIRAPILALGAAIMSVYLSPQMAVVLAAVIPLAGILVVLNPRLGFPYFRRVQKALDGINRALREYLSGVRVVKAFNRSAYELQRFETANIEVAESTIGAQRVMAFFSPAIILAVNLGIAAVLWFGGLSVRAGGLEVGKIIAFVNYMTQMLHGLMRIFIVFARFVRARASAERIGEVLAAEERWLQKQGLKSGPIRGGIEFENVSFAYAGSTGEPVLKEISFQCSPGETVGIIGPTGSGKTTLVNLIAKLYQPLSGTIRIDGLDLARMETKSLREQIGLVPQKSILFSGTVLENLLWGNARSSLEEVRRAAQIAQIDDFIQTLPRGYESPVGRGGVNLSGGQKQRLALARALLKNPAVLILDDSTSALDAVTEKKIKEGLENYSEATRILISQRITSVLSADKILVLEQGRAAGWGTHEQLLAACPVYREIYLSQVGQEEAV
ncbi:MAG: ABC transporter ATP-binding protein [Firmicutes bacterium]|nr:ABC transporter ATP-binding protein [Bacillota bacterium]